jgi:alkylated DNA repair dioxygenase AlkB
MSKLNTATTRGLIYKSQFLNAAARAKLLGELKAYHPIWEQRFSESNPPPAGQTQRRLLRPVYWLGNWQFACLNYYHPPKGMEFRCVKAEPFPPFMQSLVNEIQHMVRDHFPDKDVPRDWELNTCLVNYYGTQLGSAKQEDVARVGEHKDFEPGPVASISFGDRALFQFVSSAHKQARSQVVLQQWLEDSSLQIFGGDRYKKQLFHRVQRVEDKRGELFETYTDDFKTRRLNLTFRYVPRDHIQPLNRFPAHLQNDVKPYVAELAKTSEFFKQLLVP